MAISKILVSQPAPSADKKSPFDILGDRFGIKVDFRPFIAVEGVCVKEFISQRVKILDHSAVIFTSRALIDHFFRLVQLSRITIPDSMKYFCISEAVALYLQKYIVYRKRKIFFATGSSNSLMELILKYNGERYFLPLSEPYKPELPSALEYAGLNHSKAIISHTVCRDLSDIEPNGYDIIALYSPIEVQNFRAAFLERGYTGKLAVFGDATAKAALKEEFTIDVMAPSPKYPSMASALSAYAKAEKAGEDLSVFSVESLSDEAQKELLKMAEKRRLRNKKVASKTTAPSTCSSSRTTSSRSATPRSVSAAVCTKTLVKSKSTAASAKKTTIK